MMGDPGMSNPMSAMHGSGMSGMGGDPREAMMAAMQGGGAGMPIMPGGGDPYGMAHGQGIMAGGMGGVMDPRMAAGMGGGMSGGMGGLMDPRMGRGMAMAGDDSYGMMMQGQGGMAGGIGALMGHRMTGGNPGFDTAMGIIMGGGSRGRRCHRCRAPTETWPS